MPDIQFIVWHTPRSGSNMLMNMLHQTGVAGVRDYINCGFFVGYADSWNTNTNFEKKCNEYLQSQKTKNGVIGCKSGMFYFQDFRKVIGDYKVDKLLSTFTHHIWLQRHDKLRQSVSRVIASSTNIWSTLAVDNGTQETKNPTYSRTLIDKFLGKIDDENQAIEDYFASQGITPHVVYYEDICKSAPTELRKIIHFLGITDTYVFRQATIRKQIDLRKDDFIARYQAGK